jgi:putative transposase
VKLTSQLKLLPTPAQADALKRTLEKANSACQFISEIAWETKAFRHYDLHHACYRDVREKFDLSAQMVVRAIAKVADSYKPDRLEMRSFKRRGRIAYDERILSRPLQDSTVSIWTVSGRLHIPLVCGEHQRKLLQTRQGETNLGFERGKFFLSATCDVEEPRPLEVGRSLGIDLGITNIAVDGDGVFHSAGHINNVRHRQGRLRAKLQSKGTRSAKGKLKRLSGKERRFARDTNACISKQIVAKAKDTKRSIALEDLTGIVTRLTVRRRQRAALHRWAFFQLGTIVQYKSKREGIPVFLVDPRNTSQTCPICVSVDKANRPSQSVFSCVACGFAGNADHIAAVNIGRGADVSQPIVAYGEL